MKMTGSKAALLSAAILLFTLTGYPGSVPAAAAGSEQQTGPGWASQNAVPEVSAEPETGPGWASQNAAPEVPAEPEPGPGRNIGASVSPELNIRMVGDDLIHAAIYRNCRQADGTYNFDRIFEHITDDIRSADIAIINQETIMVSNPADYGDYPCFGTPETIGHAIASAGFDIVAHATNHTMDRGVSGIMNSIAFWKNNYPEMLYLGIHDSPEDSKIRYLTSGDITVGLVNYTYGLNGFRRPRGMEYTVDLLTDGGIEAVMQEARANCDLLIAVLHVGEEYQYTPSSYAIQQVNRFIDLGADIVLCSHPHVLEPYGMVTTPSGQTGLAYYSLGNYVSAQGKVPRMLGGMADITVRKTVSGDTSSVEIINYDLVPLVTHAQGGLYTTYRLDRYPDELAACHNLASRGFSKGALWDLFHGIIPEGSGSRESSGS